MAATVDCNAMSVCHTKSSGMSTAFPDTCNTSAAPSPIPVPYPNIAKSSDGASGTKNVTADGGSIMLSSSRFSTSSGDEAGNSPGGVVSGKFKGKAEFTNYSFDAKAEGKNVTRALDLVLQNNKNTPPFPVLQGPVIVVETIGSAETVCACCGKAF